MGYLKENKFKWFFPENSEGNKWDENQYQLQIQDNDRKYAMWHAQISAENQTHSPAQMMFTWRCLLQMKKLLGGDSRIMSHFIYTYKDNPNLSEAKEEIERMVWNGHDFFQKV